MTNNMIKELRRLIFNIKNHGYYFNREIFIGYIRCLRDLEIIDFSEFFKLENAIDFVTNKYIFMNKNIQ